MLPNLEPMRIPHCTGWLAAFLALLLAACGGDGDDSSVEPTSQREGTFDEGTVRMEIETLDTGLLKGHSYVDSVEGWTIAGIDVTAVDQRGVEWPVIEIPEEEGERSATEFFEVTIQELARGEQITVKTKVFFGSDSGFRIERTVEESWPP